jgi:hypothetical protein
VRGPIQDTNRNIKERNILYTGSIKGRTAYRIQGAVGRCICRIRGSGWDRIQCTGSSRGESEYRVQGVTMAEQDTGYREWQWPNRIQGTGSSSDRAEYVQNKESRRGNAYMSVWSRISVAWVGQVTGGGKVAIGYKV